MGIKKGSKIDTGYVTIDDGDHYREIADIMTTMGYSMNHSSVRNYVIRITRRFVDAYVNYMELALSDIEKDKIAKSPAFQAVLAERLQVIEAQRKGTLA